MISRSTRAHEEKTVVRNMVKAIEDYGRSNGLDHRFVGGISYGGLLADETSYKIDIVKRTVRLAGHNPLLLLRPDKSVRDIDLILCSYHPEKIAPLKRFLNKLKWQVRIKLGFTPPVSFEGLVPYGSTPQGLMQYVTTMQVRDDEILLVFDKIRQPVSHVSLEPWTVILEDGTSYTTRNPIADYYAYQFRSPAGVKPKDINKLIHLKKLTDTIVEAGHKKGIDYMSDEYYGPWQEYINKLENSTLPSVRSKRFLTQLYWKTIGTTLAHGKGIGKPIFAIFNFFTRHTQ